MNNSEITLRFDLDARRVVAMVGQMVGGFERLKLEVGQGVRTVQASMGKSEEAVRSLGKGVEATRQHTQQMEASTRSMDGSVTRLAAHAAAATGALQSLRGFTERVMDATMGLEKAQRTLQYATGDGAASMAFVRRTCQELGLELLSTAQAYAKFASATRGTALEGYQTQAIFKSVASATTVMGLSAEETSGTLLALSQMVSKGKVAAEELRGQLGERLPGAFQIAARAMGKTTQEFDKMLQEGKVVATDFLPRFARELKAALGDQTYLASMGPTAQVNRLKNAFTELLVAVGQSGPLKQASQDMGDMAKSLKDASENGVPRELGRFMAGTISITKGLASVLWTCRQEVLGLAAAYGVFLAMKVVGAIYERIIAKKTLITTLIEAREHVIKKALAEAGLTYQTNQSTQAQIRQAQALVASKMMLLGSRVATGELTIAEAAQERQALMTAQAELTKASAVAAGGRSAGMAATATQLLGGPLGWITLLLTVGVGAWVAWGGASETAADKAEKATEKAEKNRQAFESLTGDILELNRVLGDSKAKTDDKKRAQEEMNVVLKRMLDLYPDAIAYIKKEGENYSIDLDALKKLTDQRRIDAEKMEQQTQAAIENTIALIEQRKAQLALHESMGKGASSVTGGTGHLVMAGVDAHGIEAAEEELKRLRGDLDKRRAEVQAFLADERRLNATATTTAPEKPREESTTAIERLKADLERRKFLFEKEAFERGQLIEFTKAQEAKWLEDNTGRYNLHAKERMQADKMLFEARRHAMAQSEDAEVASLRRQMEEAKGQAMDRLRLAESIEARVKQRHGENSKEAQAAEAEVIRVRREALQEDLRFREAVLDREKAGSLTALDAEGQFLERSRELGATRGMAYLQALADLEQKKYDVQKAALEKRLELTKLDPAHDPRQVEQIKAQLDALAAQHQSRKTDLGFKMQDEGQKGDGAGGFQKALTDYQVQGADAFNTWQQAGQSAVQGLESSFGNFYASLTQHGMTAGQRWDALWKGISGSGVQALSQVMAKETALWLIQKAKLAWEVLRSGWQKAQTASEVVQSGIKATAATTETGANVANAASKTFAAHSSIPWVGIAMAVGMIALMMATMSSIKARAVGGLVTSPEITLLGEAGPELVAPEQDFKDWARGLVVMGANLQGNLQRNQDQVVDYRLQSAAYAREAQAQGERNVAEGHPFAGGGQSYIDNRGATFIGVDDRQWSDMVMRGVRTHEGMFS